MQSNPPPPTLVMNTTTGRKQVPLRDYLNARIAPFLKKAMTESVESEAEFPLQWLGECLIHQSMLYENNPDSTNIRERFRYNFDLPTAETQPEPEAKTNGVESTNTAAVEQNAGNVAAAAVAVPPPPDTTMMNGERHEQISASAGEASSQLEVPVNAPATSADVEMADTS